jgi:AraC-like DNA-binding protein
VWPAVLGHPPLPRQVSAGRDPELESKFVEIREVLILQKPGFSLQTTGIFYELLARMAERSPSVRSKESEYPEVVRNAIIYLRENYTAPFDAERTAKTVAVSQSHLRALFEKWIGESPHEFHTHCRIAQARRLLTEQDLSVSEVASQVGFQDVRYFSRVFKQAVGVSPSQYAVVSGQSGSFSQ